ncbi:MAG: hypothetical protein J5597_05190 [Spirochaetaceae bacterium]|nr:hypothetical protein [Spirochaetaceae bacterium]
MKKALFVLILLVFALTMAVAQKTEFSLGEWKDDVYTNNFLGIKFRLPDGWKKSDDETIAQIMNLGAELLNDNQKKLVEIAKLNSVYYLLANNPATGDTIIVMTEKSLLDYTTEYYLNAIKNGLQSVESIEYEIGDASKEKVAGREYQTLTAKAKSLDGFYVTQRYYVYKIDKYFLGIIVTSTTGKDTISEMMKAFE